jgi:hypothetical protein
LNLTESSVPKDTATNLLGAGGEGAALAGVSADAEPPVIVAALNKYVFENFKKRKPRGVDFWDDRALPLGACWGTQLVRQFGWQWAFIVHHDFGDTKAIGVVDKKRSMAIYPFHYVFGCFENKVTPTILLAFNMLLARKLPRFKAKSYTNVMDGVRHIVPPA